MVHMSPWIRMLAFNVNTDHFKVITFFYAKEIKDFNKW